MPAGQALPDLGHFRSDGLLDLLNVVPQPGGWSPLPGTDTWRPAGATAGGSGLASSVHDDPDALLIVPQDGAISEDVWAALFRTSAAPDANLLDLVRWVDNASNHWVILSKAGRYSATPAAYGSQFTRFGQHVIWTNGVDHVQGYQVGVSATFDDLITSTFKPKARLALPMFGGLPMLVLAYLTDGATVLPEAFAYSGLDNPTLFANNANPIPGEVADSQSIYDDMGQIYAMLRLGAVNNGGGQVFVKESSVVLLRWPPALDNISYSHGTTFPNSGVEDGNTVYWWDDRVGPVRLVAGGEPEALLHGRAKRSLLEPAFNAKTAIATGAGTRHVYGFNLPSAGCVGWLIRTENSTFPDWCDLVVLWDKNEQRVGFCEPPRRADLADPMAAKLVARGLTRGKAYRWGILRDNVFALGEDPTLTVAVATMSSQGQSHQLGLPFRLRWPYWSLEEKVIRVNGIRVEATIGDDSGIAPFVARVSSKEGPMDVPQVSVSKGTSRSGEWMFFRDCKAAQYHAPEVELTQAAVTAGYDPARVDLIHGIEVDWTPDTGRGH